MTRITLGGQPVEVADNAADAHRICQLPESGWQKWWVWVTERVNPIVVKEVRQSLKSRQFSIAFGLTLLVCFGWTLLAIALTVPRIYYAPGGIPLLVGFYCILQVPLMIIVPFSAFRSLVIESEDGTFELLSISSLQSRKIIWGKMASSMLQIVLYVSALAPCIVLTYLLRGVSLFAILFSLGLIVAFSIGETAVALLVGATCRSRGLQIAAALLLIAALLGAYFLWTVNILYSGILEEAAYANADVYLGIIAAISIYGTAVFILLQAATAAIDFPSENHSTGLRLSIFGLVTLILGWTVVLLVNIREFEAAVFFNWCVFVLMLALGALITGERGVISPRTQRTLPKTFLGRVFLTWLYPGAGMGYIFLICVFGAFVITMSLLQLYVQLDFRTMRGRYFDIIKLSYFMWCYLAIFVGLNRILMLFLRKEFPTPMLGSVAIFAIVAAITQLTPLFIVFLANDYRWPSYGLHQAFNVVWTCYECVVNNGSIQLFLNGIIVSLVALGVFGLNLILSSRDVMRIRIAEPPRVQVEHGVVETAAPPAPDPFADVP